jgi:hypothetical protein
VASSSRTGDWDRDEQLADAVKLPGHRPPRWAPLRLLRIDVLGGWNLAAVFSLVAVNGLLVCSRASSLLAG